MRTISTDDQQLRAAGGMTAYVRLSVKDSGGTWRDLTTYALGEDLVDTVEWKESTDDPGPTFTATLKREVEMLSLAPLVVASALNLGFNPSGSYAPLLALTSQVLIETAVVPEGAPPSGWKKVFRGQIDEIDWASDPLTLNGRGPQAKIVDCFIQRERVYAYCQGANADRGAFIYEMDRDYALGDLVIPTDARRNGHFYKCTTAGHSFVGDEPSSWPTGSGATVGVGTAVFTEAGTTSDTLGTPVETVMQQLLDDNMGAGVVTLHVPSSPGWEITGYKQDCVGLWEALSTLAEQSTFDLRYRYDSGADDFLLKLLAIDRAKTSPDNTFGPEEYLAPTRLETKVDDIRNSVDVVFSNSAVTDEAAQFVRSIAHADDPTSISEYDERYCRVAEASNSNINTQTEADTFAQAICDDLSQPNAEQEVPMDYWEFVEFGDLYRFSPDGLRYDQNLDLAPVAYSHKFGNGDEAPTTSLTCRGKPSGGYQRWIRKEGRAVPADVHQFNLFNTSGLTVTTTPTVGGTKVSVVPNASKANQLPPNHEFHVSDTSGFTPGPSTLVARGSSLQLTLGDQVPGKTYYVKVIPYGWNEQRIVRALPSTEVSYTAGQAKALHLSDGVEWGRKPLNGGFETSFDGVQPDHWPAGAGTWGTDILLETDGAGVEGESYVRFTDVAAARTIQSEMFNATAGEMYRLTARMKEHSAVAPNGQVQLKFLRADLTVISTPIILQGQLLGTSWIKYANAAFAPTDTKFAQIEVTVQSSGTAQGFDVDAIKCEQLYMTGVLTWVNSGYPTSSGTTYGAPGGGGGTSSANEVKLPLPDDAVIANLRVHARVAGSNMSYVITVAPDNLLSATLGSGSTDANDSTHLLLKSAGSLLSLKVVATASGSPVSPTDIVATVGIYQP